MYLCVHLLAVLRIDEVLLPDAVEKAREQMTTLGLDPDNKYDVGM